MKLKVFHIISFMLFANTLFPQNNLGFQQYSRWSLPILTNSDPDSVIFSDVWAYYNQSTNDEYAIIGALDGTHIVKIDKDTCTTSFFIPSNTQLALHRDYKSKDNFVFAVCDEGNPSLQVIDMSYLPDSVHLVYNSDTLLRKAHNIFISGNWLFAGEAKLGSAENFDYYGLVLLDISNPTNPQILGKYTQFADVHDLFFDPVDSIAYLNSGLDGMFVVDFSDSQNPQVKYQLSSYPQQGFNHGSCVCKDDSNYLIMTDETHGSPLKMVNISNKNSIFVIGTFESGKSSSSVPHNVYCKDSLVYVSYYHDGVYAFDISDKNNVKIHSYFDTYSGKDTNNFNGCWGAYPYLPSGLVLASDRQNGLFVLEKTEISTEKKFPLDQVKIFPNPISGDYFYVSNPQKLSFHYKISTVSGKIIQEGKLNSVKQFSKLNFQFSKGIYIFEMKYKLLIRQFKLVKL